MGLSTWGIIPYPTGGCQELPARANPAAGAAWRPGAEVHPARYPYDLQVHAVVVVNEHVAGAGHVFPGDVGMLLAELGGQLLDRFADDGQAAQDRVLLFGVGQEGFPVHAVEVGLNGLDGFEDVVDEQQGILFHRM